MILNLEGPLTIERAGELKDALLPALSDTGPIVLRLEKATDADIAGLQLLCSAYRTALGAGRRLLIEGPVPEAFRRAVEDGGFTRCAGCGAGGTERCPWIE